MVERPSADEEEYTAGDRITSLRGVPEPDCFASVDGYLNANRSEHPLADEPEIQSWASLKQYIQNEARSLLPNPQILLKLLTSSSYKNPKQPGSSLKRSGSVLESSPKKLKTDTVSEDTDIVIGGIDAKLTEETLEVCEKASDASTKEGLDGEKDHATTIADIWDYYTEQTWDGNEVTDGEEFFHAKLLDVLAFYMMILLVSALSSSVSCKNVLGYSSQIQGPLNYMGDP